MSKNTYNLLAARALVEAMPIEVLLLIREMCAVIESTGQKPEDVFRRVIQHHRDHAKHLTPEGEVIIIRTGMNMDEL